MLIWLNGPFGVGKSSVAAELVALNCDLRTFDPEQVGYMLRANLPETVSADFQHIPAWRALVPRVAAEVSQMTPQTLVAVQSVMVEDYWHELMAGLVREELHPIRILLDCEPRELRRRIAADSEMKIAEQWRLDHIVPYQAARPWLIEESDLTIDTTDMTVAEVAQSISVWLAGRPVDG